MSTVRFDEKEQKKIKGVNKAIYIIAKIMKILVRISIVMLAISTIIIAVVLGNLKIKDKEVQFFNKKVCTYEITDDKLIVTDGETTESFNLKFDHKLNFSDKISIGDRINLEEIIENYSSGYYIACIEIALISAIVLLVIISLVLRYIEKLFRNIYNDETPFTLDNVEYIKKIALYYIILIVSKIIIGAIIELMTKVDTIIGFNFMDCMVALIVISLVYVFKYGCEIQQETKAKMYGDEEAQKEELKEKQEEQPKEKRKAEQKEKQEEKPKEKQKAEQKEKQEEKPKEKPKKEQKAK